MSVHAAKLLLVGCGKMGGALLERTAGKSFISAIEVIDPAPAAPRLKAIPGVTWSTSFRDTSSGGEPDLIVLAVKPQQMAETLPAYSRFRKSVYLSIAAGLTVSRLQTLLGDTGHAVVRSMPNLPASIGQGLTAATANGQVTREQRDLCDLFLRSVGDVIWLEDESLMDIITAVSANGPAYVFALCEAMTEAGETLGLPKDMAAHLARKTIIGSGALLAQSDDAAAELRRAVTSPGGTTEAALKHLLGTKGLQDLMLKTIEAGAARARELAK
ncbi:MAG: pyrroline-5-carboxylate reductase [Pseudomonadota bacterium]|nr:pyrroline-5-carboxylate reductase [Pseudomonadota bacterium]